MIGKAERKAKRWLFNTIKGTDISDGDVNDIPHVEVVDENDKLKKMKELFEAKKELISKEDKIFIQGVIDAKEEANYDKVIYNLNKLKVE